MTDPIVDQMQQELIKSNEYLRIQIWILGAGIGLILMVAVAFARNAWMDVREMLGNHEVRIQKVERDNSVLMDRSRMVKAKS
jgi:hypothetical protein